MSQLITKIEEILPKKVTEDNNDDYYIMYEHYNGYNQAISDIKQTLPQILEICKEYYENINKENKE